MECSDTFTHTKTIPKLVSTHDDLAKLEDFLIKIDVIKSCSRKRMSTQWSFYHLTNLNVFAALIKEVPMGCKSAVSPNLCLKVTQSTVSRMKKIQDSHTTTTCASSVRLLFICMALNDWMKKLQYFSIYLSIKWMD